MMINLDDEEVISSRFHYIFMLIYKENIRYKNLRYFINLIYVIS